MVSRLLALELCDQERQISTALLDKCLDTLSEYFSPRAAAKGKSPPTFTNAEKSYIAGGIGPGCKDPLPGRSIDSSDKENQIAGRSSCNVPC